MTREQTDALRAMLHEELSAATERIARVEPITAGIAEPARRHHEEDRQLWRDTQNQVARLAQEVDRFVLEAATRDHASNARLTELDRVARERDDRLRERVGSPSVRRRRARAAHSSGAGLPWGHGRLTPDARMREPLTQAHWHTIAW